MSPLHARSAKWDALAETWNDTGPPASPSRGDLYLYMQYLKKALREQPPDSPVLMLGCTPRLRAKVARLGCPLVCVDISSKMFERTTASLRIRPADERLLCQNWLEMDVGRATFAAVIGDKILDNVPYSDWQTLKGRIVGHLMPGGYVITRVAPQDPSLLSQSFSALLARWAELLEKGKVSAHEAASGLWEQALGASTTSIPGRQSIAVFRSQIQELEAQHLTVSAQAVLSQFKGLFLRSLDYEWSSYSLGNVIDSFSEELMLVGLGRARDYAAGRRQPILQFRAI